MKLLIELDEEYVKAIDKIRFLVGGRTDRKLQLEIIKAIKNGKALEQEPTTKNDLVVDCISRQSVLDKIQRLIDAEQNNIDENGDDMNNARERVNAYEGIQFFVENDCLCPSVTPIRPKGHWIPVYQGDEIIGYRCSECEFGNTFGKGTIGMNFCSNCGADNREVEE